MFEIVIKPADGSESVARLVPGIYRIGSSPEAHIRLKSPEISGSHAKLIFDGAVLKVCDAGSKNGTVLNGGDIGSEPVEAPRGSRILIGRTEIVVNGDPAVAAAPSRRAVVQPPLSVNTPPPLRMPVEQSVPGGGVGAAPVLKVSGIPETARPLVQEIKRRAHAELIDRLNLKRMALSGASESELAVKAEETIHAILTELTIPLPGGVDLDKIENELVHEAIGLGPLEDLIDMDDVTEIMVNGPNQVFVERAGVLYRTDTAFAGDYQVAAAIERIVSPLGRRIDESSPMVDARLPDGSRVNAIIPPLSLVGPSITIRKFSKDPYQVDDLIGFGSLTADMARFLEVCVAVRKNIIISGGTGSGKTTLLNVLSSFLPHGERIVTIEDAAELQLRQEHVVRLESRPPNIEGKGEVNIRDLVRNSLRMRPDRIVVGECRGGEALDMLQAMNTGHDGSLTTVHANSPRDALARLETLVLMAGFDLPLRAIREQIASAIAIIVQINRFRDGSRRVTNISEITKMEGDVITMQDIFVFKQDGWSDDNKMLGHHASTGSVPTFVDEVRRANIDFDISSFRGGGVV